MKNLLIGFVIIICGVLSFWAGIYWAWSGSSPGLSADFVAKHKMLSNVFGWLSYLLLIAGSIKVVASIRQMNKAYKEESKKSGAAIEDMR